MPLRINITHELKQTKLEAKGNGSAHLYGYCMQLDQQNEDADLQSEAQLPQWDKMDWKDEQFQKRVK
ncbi:unnamed protein product [Paramecium octaurelia]|uniref:Uncharacterized protein n=1 Tax=Paramecium octaurelia TaxID=43137 RepID=A0A8S1WIH4_PAROT|nr:unnamed protein product [Paramecium octaurelia]